MLKQFVTRNKIKIIWGLVMAGTAFAFLVGCPFRLITGVPCPGCGMTHAFLAAFRFDFAEALRWHPLFPLVMLIMGGYAVWLCISLARTPGTIMPGKGREIAAMTRGLVERASVQALLLMYAILFFGVYLIRMMLHFQVFGNLP
jgi:hypothetical protein